MDYQTYLTKSRRGSKSPDRDATKLIVVLSPPGIIKASQLDSSVGVRTSRKWNFERGSEDEALRSSWICSLNAPWRARTPIVMVGEESPLVAIVCVQRRGGVQCEEE
jgi:hypothetical protein